MILYENMIDEFNYISLSSSKKDEDNASDFDKLLSTIIGILYVNVL